MAGLKKKDGGMSLDATYVKANEFPAGISIIIIWDARAGYRHREAQARVYDKAHPHKSIYFHHGSDLY